MPSSPLNARAIPLSAIVLLAIAVHAPLLLMQIPLGSYDATPMEMASAYTVFTNGGQRITPTMIRSVRDAGGDVLDNFQPEKSQRSGIRLLENFAAIVKSAAEPGASS